MRYSTEFYQQLRAIADGIDQHDHVKITVPLGEHSYTVYFAIGLEPPVGTPAYYEEVYPDLSPSAPIGTTPLMVTDWPKVRHLARFPNQRHGTIGTLCGKVGFPAQGRITAEALAALPLCARCKARDW